jgi:hypothetical protein
MNLDQVLDSSETGRNSESYRMNDRADSSEQGAGRSEERIVSGTTLLELRLGRGVPSCHGAQYHF